MYPKEFKLFFVFAVLTFSCCNTVLVRLSCLTFIRSVYCTCQRSACCVCVYVARCRGKQFARDLPTASVVITVHDEWPSVLQRTLYSVINRSPRHLLMEIILVDDNSTLSEFQILSIEQKRELESAAFLFGQHPELLSC